MEKQLRRQGSNIVHESGHKGCMGGVLHLFDFHRRFHIRKMLLDRSHGKGGNADGDKYSRDVPSTGKSHGTTDDEIKHLIEDETMSKEQGRVSANSPKLLRTFSIHYWDCNDYVLPDGANHVNGSPRGVLHPLDINTSTSNDQLNSHQLLQENTSSENLMRDVNDQNGELALDHAKELYNVDKDIFLKSLQDLNSTSALKALDVQNSSTASLLTKCGSFPGARLSDRAARFDVLKHGRKNMRSFFKQGKKTQIGLSPLISNDDKSDCSSTGIGGTCSSSEIFSDADHYLEKQMDDGATQCPSTNDTRKEQKKEKHRISMDGILHKVPFGHKLTDVKIEKPSSFAWEGPQLERNDRDGTSSSSKSGMTHFRRSHSLTESLDSYSRLLEPSNLSGESKREVFQRSKSVHGDGSFMVRNPSKSFGRMQPFPENESHKDAAKSEVSHAISSSRTQSMDLEEIIAANETSVSDEREATRTLVDTEVATGSSVALENQNSGQRIENDVSTVNVIPQDLIQSAEGDDYEENKFLDGIHSPPGDRETGHVIEPGHKTAKPSPISVLDSYFQEDIVSPAKFSVSEDCSELKPRCINFEEPDSLLQPESQTGSDVSVTDETVGDSCSKIPCPFGSYFVDFHVQVDSKGEAELNYVKDVLKKSELIDNEFLKKWFSPDQPVDPSLFEELKESSCQPDISRYESDLNLDHLVLFDLINEVLLEVYETSAAFGPSLSCSSSLVRPVNFRSQILEEVWENISWHLGCQPEMDTTLDYIVSHDLAKKNGWIDIRHEAKCMGQELEDWILDDLLDDEIVQSLTSSH